MSSNFPPNPYGNQFSQQPPVNPYGSPQFGGQGYSPHEMVRAVKGKVLPPAIFLLVVGIIGLLVAIYNVGYALVVDANPDPNAPQWMQDLQKSAVSTTTLVIQCAFVGVNLFLVASAIQMIRIKMRPLAFAASIIAMVNFGTLCCILGLPAGIWCLIILCQPDVARAFEINKQTSGL